MPTEADFGKMRIFLIVVFIIFILALANGVVKTWRDIHKEKTEVSKLEWKNVDKCLLAIRPYSLEKKRIIQLVNKIL
jgi:hypothetical protein